MSRRAVSSIFFTTEVRLGHAVAMTGGNPSHRISLVECDKPNARYRCEVDMGVAAYVIDTQMKTEVVVPAHMIRDFIWAPEPKTETKHETRPAKAPVLA